MSIFSEQNTRLAQGLIDAKAAIEAKNGLVAVSKTTPQIEEIVAGIATVKSGSVSEAMIYTETLPTLSEQYITADASFDAIIDYSTVLEQVIETAPTNYFDVPILAFVDGMGSTVS